MIKIVVTFFLSFCVGNAKTTLTYHLFTLPETLWLISTTETDSDSDPKPYHYIVLCTSFSTGLDSDSDPCMDSFSNGYCIHFRDGSPSQGSESESVSVGGNEPLGQKNVMTS